MKLKFVSHITFFILLIGLFSSCDDNKTYAELLEQEENAINKFLDSYQIADSLMNENHLSLLEESGMIRVLLFIN